MPLPHISASLPSEFSTRMRASPLLLGRIASTPSPPTPKRRSHSARTMAGSSGDGEAPAAGRPGRRSTTRKSFPRPSTFVNGTAIAYRGSLLLRRRRGSGRRGGCLAALGRRRLLPLARGLFARRRGRRGLVGRRLLGLGRLAFGSRRPEAAGRGQLERRMVEGQRG